MEGKQQQSRTQPSGSHAKAMAGHFGQSIDWRTRAVLEYENWCALLRSALAAETERRTWFNWMPVAFGVGIGAYFAADRDPVWWGPPTAMIIFGLCAWIFRARQVAFLIAIGLCAASAGILAGNWRTERIRAPALERVTIGKLTGFVESHEERPGDMRLVMLVTAFAGLPTEALPNRVRLTARKSPVAAGEHISLTARLMPPPDAARPGGYDFGRDAFFKGIGAVGSSLSALERTAPTSTAPLRLRFNAAIDVARNAMTERIARLIGGQAGAVAAALVTGKRGLISEETNEILRGAGIYHIVSISGLHMVLAAGAIFWLSRALLALAPILTLNWPLKKIAAILAMFGAIFYCIFSGSEVATERSLFMTLIMLGAILVDRPALSMRNLAFAAMVVLITEPDAALGPSFQMSFGAVAALIAFAEWQRRRARTEAAEPGLIARVLNTVKLGLAGMLVTSVLAGLATGPFGAYHFQTYNPFGLIGNMMALPFVSLVVMPAAVVGALLYPLGLDALAWWIMGLATEPVLSVSRYVAGLGGATQVVPAYGLGAIISLAIALMLFTLLTTRLRLAGFVPLGLGVALAANPDRADIYIDREAAGVAARTTAGQLAIMGKPGNFVLDQWLKADGDNRKSDAETIRAGAACDEGGCVIALKDGIHVSWSRDPVAISEDCNRADLVVTPLRWDGACKALMVDRRTLDRFGSMSVRSTANGLIARTSRNPDATRPWTRRDTTRTALPATAVQPTALTPDDDVNSVLQD